MKYLTNLSNDPKYNLAFEEYCFKNLPNDEEYVILWINGPSIIIGKNQNALEEINKEYVDENNIEVVRRVTGGGAVYHDLGNLNYSIIKNDEGKGKIDFGMINIPILKSLEKLGLKTELSGRNDITLDGKKISGIAQSIYKNRILNHGAILFDVDLTVLSDALNVKQDKIQSKGIKSVKSRVTNIRPYLKKDIDVMEFKESLLESMFEYEGAKLEEYILSEEQKREIDKLYETKYSTWEWNYGKAPKFNFKNYKRFPVGSIDIRLMVNHGLIEDITIYGDFFGSLDVKELEDKLKASKYQANHIRGILEKEPIDKYFGQIQLKDLIDLIIQ